MTAPTRYTPGGVDETAQHGYPTVEGQPSNVKRMVQLTQAQYNAIKVPDAGTLYLITA
jgi:hypothetical protein